MKTYPPPLLPAYSTPTTVKHKRVMQNSVDVNHIKLTGERKKFLKNC